MKFGERFIFSAAIGAIATALLYRGSLEAKASGHSDVASALWWHGQLLVDMATRNAGSPDDPSPGFAKLLGVPIGLVLYGAVAYGVLLLVSRKS